MDFLKYSGMSHQSFSRRILGPEDLRYFDDQLKVYGLKLILPVGTSSQLTPCHKSRLEAGSTIIIIQIML